MKRLSRRQPRWLSWVRIASLLCTPACAKSEPLVPTPEQGPTEAGVPKPPAPQPDISASSLRCGDFLSIGEANALGLDTKGYDENVVQTDPARGVFCAFGPVTGSVFRGAAFELMKSNHQAAVASNRVATASGAALGSETYWSTRGATHSVLFIATHKRLAATLSGADKALVEKTGKAIAPKMEKR